MLAQVEMLCISEVLGIGLKEGASLDSGARTWSLEWKS